MMGDDDDDDWCPDGAGGGCRRRRVLCVKMGVGRLWEGWDGGSRKSWAERTWGECQRKWPQVEGEGVTFGGEGHSMSMRECRRLGLARLGVRGEEEDQGWSIGC